MKTSNQRDHQSGRFASNVLPKGSAPNLSIAPTPSTGNDKDGFSLGIFQLSFICFFLLLLAGCGGSSTRLTVGSISATSNALPVTTLQISGQASLAVSITGDSKLLGADWTVTCSVAPVAANPNPCGTFSVAHTASGAINNFTAPSTVPPGGTVLITATATENPTRSSTLSLTIAGPPITITVAPATFSVVTGGTEQLLATVANDTKGVNWTLTCTAGGAACGTLSATTGLGITYTAPAAVPSGTVTITATSVTDPTKAASSVATITAPVPISVSIPTAPPANLQVSQTVTLSATTSDAAGVNWSATAGTFSPATTLSGATTTYSAPATVPAGKTVTLQATSVSDTSKSASVTITITAAAVPTVTITPTTAALQPNGTAVFTATVGGDSSAAGVTWSCAPAANCGAFSATTTPGNSPTVTYTAGSATGSATITATTVATPVATATATVTVASPVAVTLAPATTTVQAGATQVFTASVTGDTAAAGVAWSCAPTGSCGAFSSATTTGDSSTNTYTAPATPGAVTVTATSITDTTKSASSAVTVTAAPPGPLTWLNGKYAFGLNGFGSFTVHPTGSSLTYTAATIAGGLVADGNGNITSAEITVAQPLTADPGRQATGTYTLAANGQGSLTLTTAAPQSLTYRFTLTLFNPQSGVSPAEHLLISVGDPAKAGGNTGSLTGTLDLQDSSIFSTPPNGKYAYIFPQFFNGNGGNGNGADDAAGVIEFAAGSGVFTAEDNLIGASFGTVYIPPALATGATTFQPTDQFGRAGAGFTGVSQVSSSDTAYLIDADDILFDDESANPNWVGLSHLYQQPATAPASLAGTYAFTTYGLGGTAVGTGFAVGGIFTCNAAGGITSASIDVNSAGTFTHSTGVTGTCALDSPADGRGLITFTGVSNGVSQFAVYPTANHGLQMLEIDANQISAGAAYPQGASLTMTGSYAGVLRNLTNNPADSLHEQVSIQGPITSDGASAITGTVDVNNFSYGTNGSVALGTALTGSFADDGSGIGRLAGSITAAPLVTEQLVLYVVDANTVLTLESDANPGTGELHLQNLPQ